MQVTDVNRHNQEIQANIERWNRKPLLRAIYRSFHQLIASQLQEISSGCVVELGSGIADITEVIPSCIRTDLFSNPWVDHVENSYKLSFLDESVSNLILFDVFHHLRYPGAAMKEFHRVLTSHGRVIIFEPYISILGGIVYGLLHQEPLGLREPINWEAPSGWDPRETDYYAAQGNATRIFRREEIDVGALGWNILLVKRLCSISYVASGGYTKPQMYPTCALPIMRWLDRLLSCMPGIFGTRLLVVMEKAKIPRHIR